MVIGANAQASDSVAGIDVSGTTGINLTVKDNSIGTGTQAQNIIVIGGPCANTIAASLLNISSQRPACYQNFPVQNGQAIIKTIQIGNATAIVVAGYSAEDTRRAGRKIVNELNSLNSSYIIV
jgi:S-layer protein (TIGR01564 family)